MNVLTGQKCEETRDPVEAIHASDYQVVISLTGGGSLAISELLTTPGASRTILEGNIPYAQQALWELLGEKQRQACSGATARAMAMVAWERARQIATVTNPRKLIGLSCTASLATVSPKRGAHRIHVAVQTATLTGLVSLTLVSGARNRLQEEEVAAKLIIHLLAHVCQEDQKWSLAGVQGLLLENEPLEISQSKGRIPWTELLLGEKKWVTDTPFDSQVSCHTKWVDSSTKVPTQTGPPILFPGAFNPPHVGHLQMGRFAAKRLGGPVLWELSIRNVDKRPLDFMDISERLSELQGKLQAEKERSACLGVIMTGAPTFVEKGQLFPGCHFIVGADTMLRIGHLGYYNQNRQRRDLAIDTLASLGCRFLVFGRSFDSGSVGEDLSDLSTSRPGEAFSTLEQLPLPASLRALCVEVAASDFREDVSSRHIRSARQG